MSKEISKIYRRAKIELAIRTIESRLGYSLSITEACHDQLVQLRTYLSDHPEINFMLYSNHLSYPDPVFDLCLYFKHIDPEVKRDLVLPTSHYHSQFKNKPFFFTLVKLGEYFLALNL